jgi:PKD repeat protein
MKRLLLFIYLGSFLALSNILKAQNETIYPTKIITPIHFDVSKPLRDVKIIPPSERSGVWEDNEIENKFYFKEAFKKPSEFQGPDAVLQDKQGTMQSPKAIVQNFDGVTSICNCAPPDTDGDVGPNHYFQMINLSFQIFNKSGASLYGPAANQTLWEGFDNGTPFDNLNDGDPVILYDQYADRWVASQFALNFTTSQFYELIAVSATPDPLGVWYRYAFQFTNFPDYPKLGVWRDGYYLSINQFNAAGTAFLGAGATVLDRNAMIAGNPTAAMVFFDLGPSYSSFLPADADGSALPPSGAPGYFVEMDVNLLRVWNLSVNWAVPASSTITLASSLPTSAFNYSGINVTQPGTTQALDNLSDRLMFRSQYRNFGTYQAMVTNHSVNVGSSRAGVRWYELRNTGSGWTIYQQGTYAPADGLHRWMGSIAMNANGDIGLGYSVSGSSVYPSIRYTGRLATDPLGTMTLAEQSIFAGAASQTGVNRWGDYSAMTIDPVDDYTFWYTTEYTTGGWNWRTRIASFQFGSVPIIAQFAASTTTVCTGSSVIFTNQSLGSPTSWTWSFPGGTPSSYNGANPPAITYNTPGTYDVTLVISNGSTTNTKTITGYIKVQNVFADFNGSTTTVVAGGNVTFTDNSLCNPTSWSWSFPGGTPATATGAGPHTITYSTLGTYNVSLTVSNALGNDTKTKTGYINVINCNYCASSGGIFNEEWISNVTFNTINNTTIGTAGYNDYTAISTNVLKGSVYTASVTCGSIGSWPEYIGVFIDFNHDCDFNDTGESFDLGQTTGPGTKTLNITIPAGATAGTTRMRASLKYNGAPTSCEAFGYGEVEDYTLNIQSTDLLVDLTAFLEGPYNGSTMTQGLAGLVPLNQPYNTSPWNYTGSESVASIPANTIDWVLIELRNATTAGGATSGTRIGRKAAFLRNDGRIVNLDGTLYLNFGPLSVTNSLFVIVHHRNHVSVISATGVLQSGGIYSYNFSTGSGQAYGGTLAHKLIGTGVWGLFGGNGDGNGIIDLNDKDPTWKNQAGTKGYLKSDYNFDTHSNNKDKDNIWKPNLGSGNQVPN